MCACGNGGGSSNAPIQNQVLRPPVTPSSECLFTKTILSTWLAAIKCVKDNGNLSLIGLSEYQANIYTGNIQSALNYPEDYCYFSKQLTDYQQNILPRIIENVPTCL